MLHIPNAGLAPAKNHADDRRSTGLFFPHVNGTDVVAANRLCMPKDGFLLQLKWRVRRIDWSKDIFL